MRKFLFSGACLCLLISCSDTSTSKEKTNESSEPTATTTTTANADNLKSTPAVFKAIETGDFSAIDTLFADDIIDHGGNNGKDIKGKDSAKASLLKMHNDLKDIKLEVLANAYDNGYLLTLSHLTATTAVPWNGMPANAKVDDRGLEVSKLKDGKVTDHWHYADVNEMMKMMNMPKSNTGKKK